MLARRAIRVGTTLLLAAGLLLGALMVLPALAGYQRYVIVSGSMTGTYDRGSVVFYRVVPTGRLRTGDAAACAELVRRHGGAMLAVARRFLACEADAEDAVQDGFLSAFRSLGSFEGQSRLYRLMRDLAA